MKTFSLIWDIFITIVIVICGVLIIIGYHKTKNDTEISPEDLKRLRRDSFVLSMCLLAFLLIERICRLFPS